MRFGSRAIATALLSATALLVSPAPSSLGATTALASQPAAASTCRYSGNELSAIVAQGPRVKEQDWFRTHHVRQHARYQASVQRLVGSTWGTLSGTTQRRTPLLAATTTTMPRLTFNVPTPPSGRYRVATVIRWIGRSGSVVKTQRMVLAHYSTGGASCVATYSSPTMAMAASAGTFLSGSAVSGSFSVSGLVGSGTAVFDLYGPSSCLGCAPDSTQEFNVAVSGNGTYAMPTGSLPASGYYYWRAYVNSSHGSSNETVSGRITAMETVNWAVTSPSGDPSLNRSASAGPVQVRVDFAGFHYATTVNLTATIWGPYATLQDADAAACTGTQHVTGGAFSGTYGPSGGSHIVTDDLHAYVGKFFRMSVNASVGSNGDFEQLVAPKICSTTFRVIS